MYLVRLLLIILVTLFDSVAVIIHMTFSKSPDFHSFARRWARRLLKISGIEVVVEGSENLQKQE
ncbi:MAG: 1-acyl-sn-glycerol-3-phosphate acyltransferase, partial [Bacteroidota bacterium]